MGQVPSLRPGPSLAPWPLSGALAKWVSQRRAWLVGWGRPLKRDNMSSEFEGGPLARSRGFEPMAIVGLVFTLLMHGGAIGGVLWYRQAQANKAQPPPVGQYVVAQLVRLGKKRDPKKLPNKIVPQLPTRKPEGVSYDAEPDDKPKPKKRRRENRDAQLSDRMRSSLDKAALFAKVQPDVPQDGDPNGVRGGTSTTGSAGDLYMTRIADLWNRSWSLPSIISPDAAKNLYVLVIVRIDSAGRVQLPIKFSRKSGNEHFDASIVASWTKIGTIPLPPGDRLASVLANGLALKLTWKGMR